MSADLITLAGYAFSAWAVGFGAGSLVLLFRRITDKI